MGIAVVGEQSYADGRGDVWELTMKKRDIHMIHTMKNKGIPVVVIIISGRPIPIGSENSNMDAIIAAWYPGTEGAGVADVLFGDYNPTGTLSHSWPRDDSQIPINHGDDEYDPLFPYGFGLHDKPCFFPAHQKPLQ